MPCKWLRSLLTVTRGRAATRIRSKVTVRGRRANAGIRSKVTVNQINPKLIKEIIMSKSEDHIASLSAKAKSIMERLGHCKSYNELNEAERVEVEQLISALSEASWTMERLQGRGRLSQKIMAGVGPFIAWSERLQKEAA